MSPPPHPPFGIANKIMYFNINLRFTVIFTGPHVLTLYLYSDIVSMYSIQTNTIGLYSIMTFISQAKKKSDNAWLRSYSARS